MNRIVLLAIFVFSLFTIGSSYAQLNYKLSDSSLVKKQLEGDWFKVHVEDGKIISYEAFYGEKKGYNQPEDDYFAIGRLMLEQTNEFNSESVIGFVSMGDHGGRFQGAWKPILDSNQWALSFTMHLGFMYGYDPYGPDDPGPPGPRKLILNYKIIELDESSLSLELQNKVYGIPDKLTFVTDVFFYDHIRENNKAELKKYKAILTNDLVDSLEVKYFKNKPYTGAAINYYDRGQNLSKDQRLLKKAIINYKNGLLHGVYSRYNNLGQVTRETTYSNGQKHGPNRGYGVVVQKRDIKYLKEAM